MPDEDIRDFLLALSAAGVRHIVVGAYALATHGLVRATSDFDVLVEPTAANARRFARALKNFSDASLAYFGLSVEELSRPGFGFFMGVEPDRIDVMTKIAGVEFNRAWKSRVMATIVGVDVPTLDLGSLIAAKRASVGRRQPGSTKAFQDQADLAWLLAERERRRITPR